MSWFWILAAAVAAFALAALGAGLATRSVRTRLLALAKLVPLALLATAAGLLALSVGSVCVALMWAFTDEFGEPFFRDMFNGLKPLFRTVWTGRAEPRAAG